MCKAGMDALIVCGACLALPVRAAQKTAAGGAAGGVQAPPGIPAAHWWYI